MKKLYSGLRNLLRSINKGIVTLTLAFLPIKFTYMFLEISLQVLIVKAKNVKTTDIDMVRFFKLVNSNYQESMVELPYHSVSYIWPNEFLDTHKRSLTGRSLREIISNNDLLNRNLTKLVECVLLNLPYLLRVKLGLGSEVRKRELRNEIVRMLERKLSIIRSKKESGEPLASVF